MTRILKTWGAGLFMLLACSLSNPLFAQSKEIRGRVISAEGNQPVQGATVTVKGTKTAVVTDADGNYRITVPANSGTLVFSSIGFTSYEVSISNKTELNVTLTQEVKTGDDVVVIGYQTIKRKNVLASISSVGAKDLKDIPI